jgi:predicted HTH domain antitoxin
MRIVSVEMEAVPLVALELYREDKISLGRAAELCQMAIERFMEFSARHNVPLHYGIQDFEEDRRTIEQLGL